MVFSTGSDFFLYSGHMAGTVGSCLFQSEKIFWQGKPMSRPPIPMELKKKHKREYMRNYRKQKLQQSFGTTFQRTPSPLTAEGTHNNTADKMKGEKQV